MSGCEDEQVVPGPSAAAKPIQLSAVRIAKELEKEHQTLVELRSLVQQQLRVLQAEEVTVQRLIHHHSGSSKSTNDRRESRSHSRELEPESAHEPPEHDPSCDQLPQLDLDVSSMPLAQDRSADFSEEENESDISDHE